MGSGRFSIRSEVPPSLDVSLVIPVRDEAENVAELGAEIARALDPQPWRWECVWVDDGSRDGTLPELARLHERDPRHRYVVLDGRYGQSAALAVGFRYARGAILATLDGDGQNDPAEIPRLLRILEQAEADLVNGWRRERRDPWLRRLSSRIANGVRDRATGDRIRDVGCSLRVFRRACVEGLFAFDGMHRFLPTLIRLNGFSRILEVPVSHRPRRHGRTKYGIRNRLWVGLADTWAVRWMIRRAVRPRVRLAVVSEAEVNVR